MGKSAEKLTQKMEHFCCVTSGLCKTWCRHRNDNCDHGRRALEQYTLSYARNSIARLVDAKLRVSFKVRPLNRKVTKGLAEIASAKHEEVSIGQSLLQRRRFAGLHRIVKIGLFYFLQFDCHT
jgi:hypothetical protein